MERLVVIILCLLAGLGLRHVRSFPTGAAAALNAFVIYVALPALIFVQIPRLHIDASVLAPVVVPWALLIVSVGIVQLAARTLHWSRAMTGALMLVVPLGNTSFLGIPLTAAWLGPEAVPYAVLYDQLGSFLALTIYGAFVVAAYTERAASRVQLSAIATRIVTFPPFIALVAALIITAIAPLPDVFQDALTLIADSLVPVVVVAVGLQWRLTLQRRHWPATALALTTKLVIMPLIALAIVDLIDLIDLIDATSLAGQTAIVEAAMGPMITAGAVAIAADLEPELVASIVGYGTVCSLGTSALFALLAS